MRTRKIFRFSWWFCCGFWFFFVVVLIFFSTQFESLLLLMIWGLYVSIVGVSSICVVSIVHRFFDKVVLWYNYFFTFCFEFYQVVVVIYFFVYYFWLFLYYSLVPPSFHITCSIRFILFSTNISRWFDKIN